MAQLRRGFTLVELLVVIAIIAVLISVLIPVVGLVRRRAHDADTKQWVSQLQGAIERYQNDFRAYPGPLADWQIRNNSFTGVAFTTATPLPSGYDSNLDSNRFTMSENVVLGLLGGLRLNGGVLQYDPTQVGLGPMNLSTTNPKRYEPYLDAVHLSWRNGPNGKTGRFADESGFADDTIVPEFVDRYPGQEMPILILRAKRGVVVNPTGSGTNNSVVSFDPTFAISTPGPRPGAYDLSQIIAYTGAYGGSEASPSLDASTPPSGRSIGVGKNVAQYFNAGSFTNFSGSPNLYHGLRTVNTGAGLIPGRNNYYYPYDAFPYLQNPAIPNTARNKDSFIIISAGSDRVYGTKDDIASFGEVGQ